MHKYKNSLLTQGRLSILVIALVMLVPSTLHADSARQMNLREMCQQAEKIFRGTVVSASPGTVHVGGGELQVVTYRIRVDESFKGDFKELKGMRFAEVRMLSPQQINRSGSSRVTTYLPGMPQLIIGQPYLLFVSRANSVGLSPPVGLGRGLFRIRGEG
ncbi:MAG: hypothetical protein ND866_07340, partial [Pyrinomonadaceae bacterium]|nr:hypothetical protein [Pyrinomonadaceae bacterium]